MIDIQTKGIFNMKNDNELIPQTKLKYLSDYILEEETGVYKGYEYLITFTEAGHRNGYVTIPETHPLYDSKEDYPNVPMHGGCSFFGMFHFDESKVRIGFDGAHYGDGKDYESLQKYFPDSPYRKTIDFSLDEQSPLTLEYCREQCYDIIDFLQDNYDS